MRVPQAFVRKIDKHFGALGIWLRFLKHRLEGNRELAIARNYMPKGSVVIDGGARRGVYTWIMSRQVGPCGKVVAFEPNPLNAASLRRVFKGKANVTIAEVALSEEAGTGFLNVPMEDGNEQDSLGHIGRRATDTPYLSYPIRLSRLDDMVSGMDRRVSFIKIDVEGHELAVLRGAIKTISSDRPVIFIEIEQRHSDEPIQSRFDFLGSLGYRCYYLDLKGRLAPVNTFDLEALQLTPCRLLKPFVNMFLFVPTEAPQP